MAFWTDVFLNKVRQDWLKRIVKIQYYAGDVAGQISESITKLDTQGVITLWEFPLYEITSTQ